MFRAPPLFPPWHLGSKGLPFWFLSLMMLIALLGVRRRIGSPMKLAILTASLCLLLLWAACGGGGGGGGGGNARTLPGSYAITVTGTYTSGAVKLTRNIIFTLTVD